MQYVLEGDAEHVSEYRRQLLNSPSVSQGLRHRHSWKPSEGLPGKGVFTQPQTLLTRLLSTADHLIQAVSILSTWTSRLPHFVAAAGTYCKYTESIIACSLYQFL